MIKTRESEAFLPWLKRAKACPAEEMRRFALGLENESAAALAALTEPWSTGQVEGQITRLKLLKRQMYDIVGELEVTTMIQSAYQQACAC